jgi:hypothetical protein
MGEVDEHVQKPDLPPKKKSVGFEGTASADVDEDGKNESHQKQKRKLSMIGQVRQVRGAMVHWGVAQVEW